MLEKNISETILGITYHDVIELQTPAKNNGISKKSIADCFQVKSISKERFVKPLGVLSVKEMEEMKIGLMSRLFKDLGETAKKLTVHLSFGHFLP